MNCPFHILIYKTEKRSHVGFCRNHAYLATRPQDAIGEPERWEQAVGSLPRALLRESVSYDVSFAIMTSVSTRAIGALPAFGFTVLQALAALNLATTMRATFVLAALIGSLSAVLGYHLSFVWELPTGATMVGLGGLIYLATLLRPNRGHAPTLVAPK